MADVLSAEAQYLAVVTTSAGFTNPMAPGVVYRYVCSSASWVRVTTTGGSAAADATNNHFVPAGQAVYLISPDTSATTNGFVKAIRDTADGDATLSPIRAI